MAEPDLLLGLDAGNTVIKAVVFDSAGRQLALSKRDGASSTPAPGYVERDLNELWSNAAAVIRDCLDKAGVPSSRIAAIGCAGHGNGLYLIDAAGDPLIGIQSLDNRAAQLAEELSANRNGERLHALCLQSPWPSQTATLLAWVRRHAPEIYGRTATAFYCKDFVTFRLTGRRVSDISDMSGAGLLRMPAGTYDEELLAAYGLSDARSKLPDLVEPTAIVGRITTEAAAATGLAEGTPVVGGLFDVIASALGSGAVDVGQASIIVGTWSINQVIADEAVRDGRIFMTSVFGAARYMAIESSATSAANLEWYVRELIERGAHVENPFGIANELAGRIVPEADDPYYHPYLYGSRLGASMRAGYYGIAGWHGEGHMVRALFEGIAFEHKRHIDVLRSAGIRFDSAILSGGGARSPLWPQMFADILDMPISIASCAETGALGAAIAAGVGAGIFSDLNAGVGAMTQKGQSYAAKPALSAHYAARYATFGQITEAMKPIWASMAAARRHR
jgi:L-xylulokinase